MEPNLHTGERVLINKLAYRLGSAPHRGNVIVLVPPASLRSEEDFIKRIIGLPGERVDDLPMDNTEWRFGYEE